MAAGISIGIGADTRAFSVGVKNGVVEPLEDVSKALDDVAKDGDKAGDKLEKSFKDAQKSTESLSKEHKQLGDVIDRESKRGSDSMRRNTRDATTAAQRDLEELGNEAKQNAAETFSSFDGSAESFVDGIQGTLGGIVSSLGPIGMAAGAAGALGIGFIKSAFESAGEDSDAFKEKVSQLSGELIDTGGVGKTSLGYVADQLKDLAAEGDDAKDSLTKLSKNAQIVGHDYKDLAQAYAGSSDKLTELVGVNEKELEQLKQKQQLIDSGAERGDLAGTIAKIEAQQSIVDVLHDADKAAQEAAESESAWLAAGGPELKAKAEALDEYAESIQSNLQDAGESWTTYTVDGVTNLDAYNAAIEAQVAAVNAYQTNMVAASATLSQEALNYIQTLGADAAPLLQAYVDAPLDQQGRTAANWATLGAVSSSEYAGALIAGMPTNVQGPAITTTADTKPATADIWKVRDAKTEASILLKSDTKPAQAGIAQVASGAYAATVDVRADTSPADRQISNFVNEYRVANVAVRWTYPEGKPVP